LIPSNACGLPVTPGPGQFNGTWRLMGELDGGGCGSSSLWARIS
jgi:hypothetical protein